MVNSKATTMMATSTPLGLSKKQPLLRFPSHLERLSSGSMGKLSLMPFSGVKVVLHR